MKKSPHPALPIALEMVARDMRRNAVYEKALFAVTEPTMSANHHLTLAEKTRREAIEACAALCDERAEAIEDGRLKVIGPSFLAVAEARRCASDIRASARSPLNFTTAPASEVGGQP